MEMRGIVKQYPGVRALNGVNLSLAKGEVHALLGENGAGKSTLMKVLSGVIAADEGAIHLRGKAYSPKTPQDAISSGIAIIHQERSVVDTLNASQNIWLGRELRKGPFVDFFGMMEKSRRLMGQLSDAIPLDVQVKELSSAQQQMIEIAKAISLDAEILIMDEPTSSLTETEAEMLFRVIGRLKEQGRTIVYISHRMKEIARLCDRATILRDGAFVATVSVADTPTEKLISLMVGRELEETEAREKRPFGEEILRVEGITRRGAYEDISFTLRKGEILGIAGLVGAGRTEVARGIFGADIMERGKVFLEGAQVRIKSPKDAIGAGICLVPEERKEQGAILRLSVRENISLVVIRSLCRGIFVNRQRQQKLGQEFSQKLRIKTPSLEQHVRNLSGGNQQKVVLAKWLAAAPKVLILDEPTRGIDVGAKREIYELIRSLAAGGMGVIVISSEMAELLMLCDNIFVMREHRSAGFLSREEATEEKIMSCFVKEP